MSYKLKQCIKKKAKLYKLYLKGKISKNDYTLFKNRLTAVLRRSKRLYYAKVFLEVGNNPRKMWSTLNSIICKKNYSVLTEVKVGDTVLSGQSLVNYANDYFVKIASSLTSNSNPPITNVFRTDPVGATCFFLSNLKC